MKGTFSPYFLSYEDINSHAESFLATHHPKLRLPVPIEEIAEFNLRIDIFPFPNLRRTFDIEGFISGYDVSRDVLVKRISKEIEKGFLAIS